MRICFICLIFVLIFFDREKEVPVSTTHDAPLHNMPTINMTQISENNFVLQEKIHLNKAKQGQHLCPCFTNINSIFS